MTVGIAENTCMDVQYPTGEDVECEPSFLDLVSANPCAGRGVRGAGFPKEVQHESG